MPTFTGLAERARKLFEAGDSQDNATALLQDIGCIAARLYVEHARRGRKGFHPDIVPKQLTGDLVADKSLWDLLWLTIESLHARPSIGSAKETILRHVPGEGTVSHIEYPSDRWRWRAADTADTLAILAEAAGESTPAVGDDKPKRTGRQKLTAREQQILNAIGAEPKSDNELAQVLGITPENVRQHITKLRRKGCHITNAPGAGYCRT